MALVSHGWRLLGQGRDRGIASCLRWGRSQLFALQAGLVRGSACRVGLGIWCLYPRGRCLALINLGALIFFAASACRVILPNGK